MKRIIIALAILVTITGPAAANLLEANRADKQRTQGPIVLWGVNQPQSERDHWWGDRLHKATQALSEVCSNYRHPVPKEDFADWFVEVVNNPYKFRQIHIAGGAEWFTVFQMFGYWWRGTYCEGEGS